LITEEEWKKRLIHLLTNIDDRIKMGKTGRQKVINEYSVHSNTRNFTSLFN